MPVSALLALSLVIASLLASPACLAVEKAGRSIRLLDDRNEPISGPLEVCLTLGLERSCRPLADASRPFVASGFDVITVEGPEHGPVSVRRLELRPGDDGVYPLMVPRKGRLRVRRLPAEPVGLSLYKKDDPTFRRPVFRLGEVTAGEVRVPAGELVVSLTSRGFAPDLHLLSMEPGGSHVVDFRRRPGWSLVLRAVSADARQPLDGVAVEMTPTPGYGTTGSRRTTPTTERSGLTVISGLTAPLVTAALRRPGWIERQEPGLSASPGSFTFREVPVERGGSVRAMITREGKPAAAATCQLRRSREAGPRQPDEPSWTVVFEGTTGRDGACRAEGVPQGGYSLWVRPAAEPPESAALVTAVQVESGRETVVELDLAPIVVDGTVLRGKAPAPGWRIGIGAVAGATTTAEEVAEAETDEEGRYRVVLWAPGEYFFAVTSPEGAPALFEREDVSAAGATRDFHLAAHQIEGVVVDGAGQPVGQARVGVRWNDHRLWHVTADEAGRFAAPLEAGGGTAELTAHRKGYHSSEAVRIEVPNDGAPPPAVLVLRKSDDLTGVLVSSAGAPVAGAWVAAYETTADGMPWQLGATTTDDRGHFSVPRARGSLTQLVVTGPGCPLSIVESRPDGSSLTLTCAEAPANLEILLRDTEGRAVSQEVVALRRGSVVVPREAVAVHLARLGLPAMTDGHGRLLLPALAPGEYDLYLGSGANPMTMAAGLPFGHLTTAALRALTTTELEVTVRPAGE